MFRGLSFGPIALLTFSQATDAKAPFRLDNATPAQKESILAIEKAGGQITSSPQLMVNFCDPRGGRRHSGSSENIAQN